MRNLVLLTTSSFHFLFCYKLIIFNKRISLHGLIFVYTGSRPTASKTVWYQLTPVTRLISVPSKHFPLFVYPDKIYTLHSVPKTNRMYPLPRRNIDPYHTSLQWCYCCWRMHSKKYSICSVLCAPEQFFIMQTSFLCLQATLNHVLTDKPRITSAVILTGSKAIQLLSVASRFPKLGNHFWTGFKFCYMKT